PLPLHLEPFGREHLQGNAPVGGQGHLPGLAALDAGHVAVPLLRPGADLHGARRLRLNALAAEHPRDETMLVDRHGSLLPRWDRRQDSRDEPGGGSGSRPPVTSAADGSPFCGSPRLRAGNFGWAGVGCPQARRPCPYCLWCSERPRSARWFDWDGERFRPFRLVTASPAVVPPRPIPFGRPVLLPGPPPRPPAALPPPLPPPLPVGFPALAATVPAARRAWGESTRQAAACAELAALPVQHRHAAGIDVGDQSHWVCVESTPDGCDTVREFAAHTAGLRQLVAWLRRCCVTTVALEATGVHAHALSPPLLEPPLPVLPTTLWEAGLGVGTTPPKFTRQIQGRPKTDKRDCQWIQRLHRHGLLPAIFQPDEATHTLRDYVRQRANLVRLSGQHVQRMQKALELMNLKLTAVLGD